MTDAEFQALLDACDQCIAYRGLIDADDAKQTMRDILHVMRYTALRPGGQQVGRETWKPPHPSRRLLGTIDALVRL